MGARDGQSFKPDGIKLADLGNFVGRIVAFIVLGRRVAIADLIERSSGLQLLACRVEFGLTRLLADAQARYRENLRGGVDRLPSTLRFSTV